MHGHHVNSDLITEVTSLQVVDKILALMDEETYFTVLILNTTLVYNTIEKDLVEKLFLY